jgi:hypothetical protein
MEHQKLWIRLRRISTSNSTQRCLTINEKVQKKVLWTLNMQVLMLGMFLSFFSS